MARRKTVQRSKKQGTHLHSRNKKIRNTQREQRKIAGWNMQLSFTRNLDNLGMNTRDVNEKIANLIKQQEENPEQTQHIEAEEISMDQLRRLQQQSHPDPEKAKNKVRMNIDEEWAVESLVRKHKKDWEAMRRDHKLNTFQWTKT